MKTKRENQAPSLTNYFSIINGKSKPKYLKAKETILGNHSVLESKAMEAEKLLRSCIFCEHRCRVDRQNSLGVCKVGKDSFVSSAFVHLGEEPELVPSGTIFFSGCNFRCCFCQNWDISQNPKEGYKWNPEMIATWVSGMRNGIKNVNLVGGEPTPHLHTILRSLLLLNVGLPIVWNSNMYMSEETMKILDGVVDLYLSDFKYGNDKCAEKNSGVKNYFSIVSRNHRLAKNNSELLIRHLVLPGHIECCSKPILKWIKENLGSSVRVNLMGQYRPEYKASGELGKRVSIEEYEKAAGFAEEIGLYNILLQYPR